MARSRAQATASNNLEKREIIAWYEDLLERTPPPVYQEWEPVKIGPTWQWNNGWLLPEVSMGWERLYWCGKWCQDKHGQPWQFTAEQARFLLWYDALEPSGDLVYHSAVFQRLKGHGKDPLASCVSVTGCFADVRFDHWDGDVPVGREESNAWVQILAVSQEQTKNTMKLFPSLITPEAIKRYGIQVGKLNVYGLGDTRQIEAVTSNFLSVEGGRPTQLICGETQNWNRSNQGFDMIGAIEGNAAKSEGGAARRLDICNAPRPDEESVGLAAREGWEATQAREGEQARAADFGLLYDSLEAPPNAPLTAEAAPAVLDAVKGDSYWLDTRPNGRIVKSILNPANSPNESRRKWYNQLVATADAWMSPLWWDAIEAPGWYPADGDDVLLFFDGSKSDDATALIGCHEATGNVFAVKIWQKPPHEQKWIVDRADVDLVGRRALDRWRVIGCWGDPSDARDDETGERFWEDMLDGWARDYKFELPAVKTGDSAHPVIWDMRNPRHLKAFTEEAERFVTDVREGAFRQDGHRLLQQHVRNARRRANKFGVGLGKSHRESPKKVDGAVCAVGGRRMWREWQMVKPKPRTGEAVFF